MKSTGIVRKTDKLNRICLPRELCRTYGIDENTPLEIYTDGDFIMLRKFKPDHALADELRTIANRIDYNSSAVDLIAAAVAELEKKP